VYRRQLLIRCAALFAASLNLFAVYYLGVRPWYRSWGTDASEATMVLPGDELVPAPRLDSGTTRAITIHAPRAAVWPWVAQIGQDRAGFYSYELLEDLVGCRMPSADRIHPEFQAWRAGDKLWMYPPSKLSGLGHAVLVRHEHEHVLAFATHQVGTPASAPYDGLWNFVLEPLDQERTRLLVRGRAGGERGLGAELFDRLVFEPIHFVMERRMLEEIKGFAEGHPSTRAGLAAQPLAWASLLVLMGVCAVRVVRGRDFPAALALFIVSAAALQALAFLQPAAWVGVAVSALLWLSWLGPKVGVRPRDATAEHGVARVS
jgi:hypothetical protein